MNKKACKYVLLTHIHVEIFTFSKQNVSKYDKKIPQSHIANQLTPT